MKLALWSCVALVLAGCTPQASPAPPAPSGPQPAQSASPPIASAPPVVSSSASVTPPRPAQRPSAAFVALADGKPWTTTPLYDATLMDSLALADAARSDAAPPPRQISLDVTRGEDGTDGERLQLTIDVIPGLMGQHPYVCHGNSCSPPFQAMLHRAHDKDALTIVEPSSIEVLKNDSFDAESRIVSVSFDLTFGPLKGKGKKERVVGIIENATVTDLGHAVGMVASHSSPMVLLPVSRIPDAPGSGAR